jgi:hypothetical protein
MDLRVDRIGYLVPEPSFVGTVQSVYARACNVASDGLLLTLVAPDITDGPTTFVLAGDRVVDLRTCFRVRERVVRCGDRVKSPGADVDLAHAASWQPDARPVIADPAQVAANLHGAATRLAVRIEHGASVIHREGRAACARIEQACGDCHVDRALLDALPLIGWGEGLTPAGDDFLVGVLAGLDALATVSTAHAAFLSRFSDGVVAHRNRTTAIAAHCLNLAASGHFSADVHRLRGAVLASTDVAEVAQLADDALAVGATSGADLVAGLLAGISAWLPAYSFDEHPDDD